ncbi:acyl carrier protein [Nostoc sp. B(2019)]|nr:acyl carrier protein [Nostoc sp. B(2019)]
MGEQTLENQQISTKSMSTEDMQDWLTCQIAEQVGTDPDEIDIRAPFDSYGLDSVQTMNIANLGKQYFGLQLSPLIIWNYPNVESLSQYLAEELKASELEMFEI